MNELLEHARRLLALAHTGLHYTQSDYERERYEEIASIATQLLSKESVYEIDEIRNAWQLEDGYVTEGGSSSAFILTKDDVIVTRKNSNAILPGCTRKAVVALAEERQLRVEERSFTVEEALAAKEAFATSASLFVQPVVAIDGKKVGDGKPGPLAARLREIYVEFAKATAV